MTVYIGAAVPLPLVAWDEQHRGFHVDALAPSNEFHRAARDRLGAAFAYSAGSCEGCGCGFQYRQRAEWRDHPGEYELEKAALQAFRDYVHAALAHLPEVRVLAFWEGEVANSATHKRELAPDDLLRDDFYFLEGESSAFQLPSPA